jgi:hypothetical protein
LLFEENDAPAWCCEERKRLIWNMWLACYTQEEIAEATGITRQAIDLEIETFANIGHVSDFCKSRSLGDIGNVSDFAKSLKNVTRPPVLITQHHTGD